MQNYLSNRLKDYIEDDSILKDIDDEIKTITEGEKNDQSSKKNQKKIEQNI